MINPGPQRQQVLGGMRCFLFVIAAQKTSCVTIILYYSLTPMAV